MKYKNESLGVSFEIPDRITVRKQLEYKAALIGGGDPNQLFVKLWEGAAVVVSSLECSDMELSSDALDKADSANAAEIAAWVGTQVNRHMKELETLPKN